MSCSVIPSAQGKGRYRSMEKQTPPERSQRVGLKSSAGPREPNEDNAFIQDYVTDATQQRYLCLGAVADGMGGHKAGEAASSAAIQLLFREFNAQRTSYGEDPAMSTEDLLFELFSSINATVYDITIRDEDLKGMGTTLTAFLAEEGQAFIAHVGDSRAYLVRDASITQLTEDHTLVENMVKENVITREQAATHSDRHVITRAIGVDQTVQIDLLSFDITPGDVIMLCTDGLYDVVSPQDVLMVLGRSPSIHNACEDLVRLAIDNNTTDNVTVLLWVVPGSTGASDAAADLATGQANNLSSPPEGSRGLTARKPAVKKNPDKTTLAIILIIFAIVGFVMGWLIAGWTQGGGSEGSREADGYSNQESTGELENADGSTQADVNGANDNGRSVLAQEGEGKLVLPQFYLVAVAEAVSLLGRQPVPVQKGGVGAVQIDQVEATVVEDNLGMRPRNTFGAGNAVAQLHFRL